MVRRVAARLCRVFSGFADTAGAARRGPTRTPERGGRDGDRQANRMGNLLSDPTEELHKVIRQGRTDMLVDALKRAGHDAEKRQSVRPPVS